MNKEEHYLIVIDGSAYKRMYEKMFADVVSNSTAELVVDEPRKKLIKRLLLRKELRFLNHHFDFITYEENALFVSMKRAVSVYNNVFVIFTNGGLYFNGYFPYTLKRYRKKFPNVKFILLYLDIRSAGVCKNANLLSDYSIFDLIYTIDNADSCKYKYRLWNTMYSKDIHYLSIGKQYDLYFCGAIKDRGKTIKAICYKAEEKHIDLKMDLVKMGNDSEIFLENLEGMNIFDRFLAYDELLRNELSSNCILDIVQSGQEALTLRPYEAVVYNKKLLTNNKSILSFSYYNSSYMKLFDSVEDIDWDWVKEQHTVNYNYKNEFSAAFFLSDIANILQN